MLKKATILHLRIPFSFFLMPIFCFTLSLATEIQWTNIVITFIALHLFLYPASNGYNSYFDKDEESIGGLEKPPPVDKELYYVSLLFDGIALLLGLFIGWEFALGLFLFGLVSKAYSHDSVRLKKKPILGWLTVGVFQGAFTFLMVYLAIHHYTFSELIKTEILLPAFLSTALLLGSYPMTQIYQHKEDGRRGDMTISRMLGIKGTFIFTALFFICSSIGFMYFYIVFYELLYAILFQIFLLPVLIYFLYWFYLVWQDETQANFKRTMQLNLISSVCLNIFFITVLAMRHV